MLHIPDSQSESTSTSVYTRESEYSYHSDQSWEYQQQPSHSRFVLSNAKGGGGGGGDIVLAKRGGGGGLVPNVKAQFHDFLCSFHGLLTVCGLILCIKYAPAFYHWVHPHYWDAPKTWDTCDNMMGQTWPFLGSPCVNHDDALCTYSVDDTLFSWCSGRYYMTRAGSQGKWTKFAADVRVLPAIWTAGDSCDELGFKGWDNVCSQQQQGQQQDQQQGQQQNQNYAASVECKMNQLRGVLYCLGTGQAYTYNVKDGSYARYNNRD
jgi:hypothetical protein